MAKKSKKSNQNEKPSQVVSKQFTDFTEYMEYLGGLTYQESKKLVSKDPDLNELINSKIEDDGTYANIFACFDNEKLVKTIAEEFDLQIITYSIEECDDEEEEEESDIVGASISCYSTGFGRVNRERYYFCRSKEDASCAEKY